ncbi:MAG: ACP phosphodiesterase [Cyclobacteriaceae bacterium]|nr:ACP phosphodiesterase [Cyclobacteriaceae bacterium]
MNFLAHLHLSGPDPEIMVGNFIGDFVKGRELEGVFGKGIARGVALHRAIDEFTDRHPVVKLSKARLRPKYGHYAGVIVDIFYDHFLAVRWSSYSDISLTDYASQAYRILEQYDAILPERVKQMMPYMMKGNWLVNYATLDGIQRSLNGISRRATFDSKMEQSTEDLKEHYADFEREFVEFFAELQSFANEWLQSSPHDLR